MSPTLPCNICKKRFEKLTALDHHIRANHPVLQCECCGKTLRSKPDLNLHLHKHHYAYNVDDTENYFCQSPSLSKTNFDSQSIHEMYNTADLLAGPPRCNVCGYHSLSIPDLNLHKHRHHGNISQAGSEPGPNAFRTSLDPQRPSHLQLTGAESPPGMSVTSALLYLKILKLSQIIWLVSTRTRHKPHLMCSSLGALLHSTLAHSVKLSSQVKLSLLHTLKQYMPSMTLPSMMPSLHVTLQLHTRFPVQITTQLTENVTKTIRTIVILQTSCNPVILAYPGYPAFCVATITRM